MQRVAMQIVGIEHSPRPKKDVPKRSPRKAHSNDIEQLAKVPKPSRHGQRPKQAHPHVDPKPKEHRMLKRMHPRVFKRPLVEDRQVPSIEVDRPKRKGDQRAGKHPQTIKKPNLEDRRNQRPSEPKHDQQRRNVAKQQMLDHVHEQQFLAGLPKRGERRTDHNEPRVEASLPPPRHGVPMESKRAHAPRIEQAKDRQRPKLHGGKQLGGDGKRRHRDHDPQPIRGAPRQRRRSGTKPCTLLPGAMVVDCGDGSVRVPLPLVHLGDVRGARPGGGRLGLVEHQADEQARRPRGPVGGSRSGPRRPLSRGRRDLTCSG